MYMKDGLHLSGKGAAMSADELSTAVKSSMGSMPQIEQEATSTHKPVTKCPENISEAGYKCVCLNARSIVNPKKHDCSR